MFVSLICPFQFCPHSFQCTYRATLLCHLLYSRWANLPHSLVRWLTLFSFSPHILHIGDSDAELKKPCSELHFTRAIIFKPPRTTSEVESRCHILVAMNVMFLWVSVISVPFLQAHKTYMRKNKVMEPFPSRLAIRLVQNVCLDLICTTNTSSVRSGLASLHTYSMKMVTGNPTLRAYSPWWKFTKVSGGSAFLCMKSYILEYNNDSKFGLDTFNES